MQPLRFLPRTVEKTQLWVLFCLLRQRCHFLPQLSALKAGLEQFGQKTSLILINVQVYLHYRRISLSISIPRRNQVEAPPCGIFPWTWSCVGKGNQSDLTGIEYFIVRQRGGEYLPRRFKKDLQLSLNMCAGSYSEVLNCIITIETSTFTNVCDSNISTECKTVKLFRVVRVWICKQGFVYHLIAIYFLLIFM